jgi:hypothetical protein
MVLLVVDAETFGFLMQPEQSRDQHGNGHCGGEHENHHGSILLCLSNGGCANWLRAANHERFTWLALNAC